jgi:hypothetical protein
MLQHDVMSPLVVVEFRNTADAGIRALNAAKGREWASEKAASRWTK